MEGTVLRNQSSPASAWYTVAYFFSPYGLGVVWGVAVCSLCFCSLSVVRRDKIPTCFHLTLRKAVCVSLGFVLRDLVKVGLQVGPGKDNHLDVAS